MPQEIPYGYCHCGCGQKTNLAWATKPEYGWVRGKPHRFLSGHNSRISSPAKRNTAERFWSKVEIRSDLECWPWTGRFSKVGGYGHTSWAGKEVVTHRIAWELTHSAIPLEMCVLHHCDNPICCNPQHLFLGTRDDNNKDRARKGRSATGIRAGRAKLTDQDVQEIRTLFSSGKYTKAQLNRMFNVSHAHIRKIVQMEARVV